MADSTKSVSVLSGNSVQSRAPAQDQRLRIDRTEFGSDSRRITSGQNVGKGQLLPFIRRKQAPVVWTPDAIAADLRRIIRETIAELREGAK